MLTVEYFSSTNVPFDMKSGNPIRSFIAFAFKSIKVLITLFKIYK